MHSSFVALKSRLTDANGLATVFMAREDNGGASTATFQVSITKEGYHQLKVVGHSVLHVQGNRVARICPARTRTHHRRVDTLKVMFLICLRP